MFMLMNVEMLRWDKVSHNSLYRLTSSAELLEWVVCTYHCNQQTISDYRVCMRDRAWSCKQTQMYCGRPCNYEKYFIDLTFYVWRNRWRKAETYRQFLSKTNFVYMFTYRRARLRFLSIWTRLYNRTSNTPVVAHSLKMSDILQCYQQWTWMCITVIDWLIES